ncbi:MAG: hypothetical protein CMJ53_02480 [Planctomycetaceae bacterium]|nr:hypothetical protein [Planctomycetaceae bacterium]
MRLLKSTFLMIATLVVAGCSNHGPVLPAETTPPRSLTIHRGDTGTPTDFTTLMLPGLTDADVIVLGEEHDDVLGHRLQREIVKELIRTRPGLVVGLEMLERDKQDAVDAYMSDQIDRDELLTELHEGPKARANFTRFSLPMLELAKAHDIPVFAANAPRHYVKRARLEGYDPLKALPAEEQAFFTLPEALDEGDYRDRLKALLIENGIEPTDERLLPGQRAQEVWDATMADSVCDALERDGAPVLLVVGRFHGDFDGGTVARIEGMRPGIDVRYVVMVGSPSGPLRPEDRGRGDFVIYTDARRANE